MKNRLSLLLLFFILPGIPEAMAEKVRVAVASNFVTTLRALSKEFTATSGHTVLISSGSSGKHYTQISNGAPFDVFMSADAQRPRLLEENGLTVPKQRFTYALGKLALWSSEPELQGKDCKHLLMESKFNRLAMANPKTAPYGLAAQQVLTQMGLWETLKSRLVRGENIGQTFLHVATRNAPLGFIALSQAVQADNGTCRWDVPQEFYTPIQQQVVLLNRGTNNPAATTFMTFLKSDQAVSLITRSGYGTL